MASQAVRRYELTDEQWERVAGHFPANGGRGGQWRDHRQVVNACLWVLCSGAPWRDLPDRYGPSQTAHRRLARWRRDGTWERVLRALRVSADARGLIDSDQWNADATNVRAARAAAGARKKRGATPTRTSRPTTGWAAAAAGSGASCTC